jgi:predicted small secreted protein
MKNLAIAFALISFAVLAAACGSNTTADAGKTIKSAPVGNNLTVTLSNKEGVLKHGDQEVLLTFKDASGKPVEVGAVALNFFMPAMGTMPAMNDQTSFTTTTTPGVYRGKVNIEVAGEWQAQVSYEGPAGSGKTSFPVMAQ